MLIVPVKNRTSIRQFKYIWLLGAYIVLCPMIKLLAQESSSRVITASGQVISPIPIGYSLEAGAKIETGSTSTPVQVVMNGVEISVGPNTQATVDSSVINLSKGQLSFSGSGSQGSLSVVTAAGTVPVGSGQSLSINFIAQNNTAVIRNISGSLAISAGTAQNLSLAAGETAVLRRVDTAASTNAGAEPSISASIVSASSQSAASTNSSPIEISLAPPPPPSMITSNAPPPPMPNLPPLSQTGSINNSGIIVPPIPTNLPALIANNPTYSSAPVNVQLTIQTK